MFIEVTDYKTKEKLCVQYKRITLVRTSREIVGRQEPSLAESPTTMIYVDSGELVRWSVVESVETVMQLIQQSRDADEEAFGEQLTRRAA